MNLKKKIFFIILYVYPFKKKIAFISRKQELFILKFQYTLFSTHQSLDNTKPQHSVS